VLILGKKYTAGSKIFFKAINWRRAVIFRVGCLKALISSGGGIDLLLQLAVGKKIRIN
jgi:hypothetical protein